MPDSGRVPRNGILIVTVNGRGFEPGAGANTVTMGPLQLTRIEANASGTELQFAIPDRIPSTSSVKALLSAGAYDVAVSTSAGTSNSLTFKVLP